MSSMNIQIGFLDSGPKKAAPKKGQSHTDIFGTSEPVQPTPKKNMHASNIQNILTEETDSKVEDKEDSNIQKENKTENTNGNGPMQTPQRVRMPPGGHSSTLW